MCKTVKWRISLTVLLKLFFIIAIEILTEQITLINMHLIFLLNKILVETIEEIF